MHYRYKVNHPSKIKLGLHWLKSNRVIGIYQLEDGRDTIIGGFSPGLPKEPNFLKLLSCENEEINWESQWEEKIIEVSIHNHFFKLKAGPGFGDSTHPTTQLCMEALAQLRPSAVLDIGSGSGILSLAAISLGIKEVIGIEIDPKAISHHQENIQLNHFKEMKIATHLSREDLNHKDQLILINMILSEQKQVFDSMPEIFEEKKRWYASGILSDGLEEATRFYVERGLKILRIDHLEKWCGIYMEKS